jgi:hypothetical protein
MCNTDIDKQDIVGYFEFYYGTHKQETDPRGWKHTYTSNGSESGVICYKCANLEKIKELKQIKLTFIILTIFFAVLSLVAVISSLVRSPSLDYGLVVDLLMIGFTLVLALISFLVSKRLNKAKQFDKTITLNFSKERLDNLAIDLRKSVIQKLGYHEFYTRKRYSDIFLKR